MNNDRIKPNRAVHHHRSGITSVAMSPQCSEVGGRRVGRGPEDVMNLRKSAESEATSRYPLS